VIDSILDAIAAAVRWQAAHMSEAVQGVTVGLLLGLCIVIYGLVALLVVAILTLAIGAVLIATGRWS
jgi:hypothetical protein